MRFLQGITSCKS